MTSTKLAGLTLALILGMMLGFLFRIDANVRAIRESLDPRHVQFRVSPSQQRQKPERMLL